MKKVFFLAACCAVILAGCSQKAEVGDANNSVPANHHPPSLMGGPGGTHQPAGAPGARNNSTAAPNGAK